MDRQTILPLEKISLYVDHMERRKYMRVIKKTQVIAPTKLLSLPVQQVQFSQLSSCTAYKTQLRKS